MAEQFIRQSGYTAPPTAKPDSVAGEPPLIPTGFDPIAATPEQLNLYGLPPRPDPKQEPSLYAAWSKLFARPLVWVDPLRPLSEDSGPAGHLSGPRYTPTRFETSQNWSGAYIEPNGGNMFVLLIGGWTVPTPKLPPDAPSHPPVAATYNCSNWIGLDGQRRYLNSSLPQVGTEQILVVNPNGSQSIETQAWFQWWARNEVTIRKTTITEVPVRPGDYVIAALWVIDKARVSVIFHNLTTGKAHRRFGSPPQVRQRGGTLATPIVSGATAEWITERPAVPGSAEMYLFPDYTSVTFDCCVAGAARGPGPATAEAVLRGARFLRMYEVLADPPRTGFISMPVKVSDTSVTTTYGDFSN